MTEAQRNFRNQLFFRIKAQRNFRNEVYTKEKAQRNFRNEKFNKAQRVDVQAMQFFSRVIFIGAFNSTQLSTTRQLF